MRPVLAPATRRFWRDAVTLQLGTASRRAVVLEGLLPTDRPLLTLLDGVRTLEQVLTEAGARGYVHPERLLGALRDAGLLLDADLLSAPGPDLPSRERFAPDLAALSLARQERAGRALAARRDARVVVHGAGRVGAPLAALLAQAGVGAVDARDPGLARQADVAVGGLGPADVGRTRGDVMAQRLPRSAARQRPDVVVLTERAPVEVTQVLLRDEVPHLSVQVDGHIGVVGPLVLPGRSACLHCLALVRTAVDAQWPALAALEAPEAADGVLAVAVAAQAALQVLALLEGDRPASVDGTLELELPDWRWRRRSWPQHPGCRCAA